MNNDSLTYEIVNSRSYDNNVVHFVENINCQQENNVDK